jgi:hypothetical protein
MSFYCPHFQWKSHESHLMSVVGVIKLVVPSPEALSTSLNRQHQMDGQTNKNSILSMHIYCNTL